MVMFAPWPKRSGLFGDSRVSIFFLGQGSSLSRRTDGTRNPGLERLEIGRKAEIIGGWEIRTPRSRSRSVRPRHREDSRVRRRDRSWCCGTHRRCGGSYRGRRSRT